MKTAALCLRVVLFLAAMVTARGFSWQDSPEYRPPDFEAHFPHDPDASKKLEAIINNLERGQPPANVFEILRLGLRALPIDRQMPALRGFGNSFIWNKSPQNPEAIELMYHAAGSTNPIIHYNAIYFGLSTVRPMTQSILRTLVEVGMNSDDPNVLSRIAWGGSAHKAALVRYLQPHLDSLDPKRREHAEDLRKIFSGEVKAFAWAEQRAKIAMTEKYSHRLDEIRDTLTSGDSKARREILDLFEQDRIALILDDSFIPAFAAAATEPEEKIRKAIALIVGSRWIWGQTHQPAAAIDLIMRLSTDPARDVRYNANYYGLSTIRNRSDAVVERMLEMTLHDGFDNSSFRRRITWGLRDEKPAVARVLDKWIKRADQIRALFAYGFYLDFFAAQPDLPTSLTDLLEKPDQTIAHIVAFLPNEGWKVDSMDEYFNALRDEVPGSQKDRILWTNNQGPPFLLLHDSEVAPMKKHFVKSPRFKIEEWPLSVDALIHLGKTGGLKTFTRK